MINTDIVERTRIQQIYDDIFDTHSVEVFVKREDCIHPVVSGNKWRKIKYNIFHILSEGRYEGIVSFGGAYSNHLHALSEIGSMYNIPIIAYVRGEEILKKPLNKTLEYCRQKGMVLRAMPRTEYAKRNQDTFKKNIQDKYPKHYILPEGGANMLGVKGCMEIIQEEEYMYDYILIPIGTGTTLAGILLSKHYSQKVIAISSFKQNQSMMSWVSEALKYYGKAHLEQDVHWDNTYRFGGFAKTNQTLISFIANVQSKHNIPFDYIYNGKMMFALYQHIPKHTFPKHSKILCIHTGGLQGRPIVTQ